MSKDQFCDAVGVAKTHIREGDVFQIVLSKRLSLPFHGDPFNLYRALRQVSPSPYLYYVAADDYCILGSSPEQLVRVEGDRVETVPIAGTRRRSGDAEEDLALERELVSDPKERAEHIMLVDLGRNDIGRVAKTGSVTVSRLASVERFSHVMHMVSTVAGTLDDGRTALDALAACFPAGTVTGAPKIRAMEIINELEASRRGVYAGAIGYIDYSGNMDTCIAIRTMVVRDGIIHVQAGAGIVADSIPESEFLETEHKARALIEAAEAAAAGLL
jgi:anthranilate synthase component 1